MANDENLNDRVNREMRILQAYDSLNEVGSALRNRRCSPNHAADVLVEVARELREIK